MTRLNAMAQVTTILSIFTYGAFAFGCSRSKKRIEYTVDKGTVRLITFPGRMPWLGVGKGEKTAGTVILLGRYEVRRAQASPDLLFMVVDAPEVVPPHSVGAYAAHIENGVRVRAASLQEWQDAIPLPEGKGDFLHDIKTGPSTVRFHGKMLGRSLPAELCRAIPSPSGRWLALIAAKPSPKPPPSGPWSFLGGGPSEGEIFLDVYDADSGELAVSSRFVAEFAFSGSLWAGDDALILPLERNLNSCAVALLPSPRQ